MRASSRASTSSIVASYSRIKATIDEVLARLDARNHAVAVELAWLPEHIRGYGHVKAASVEAARQERAQLLARLRGQQEARIIPIHPRAA